MSLSLCCLALLSCVPVPEDGSAAYPRASLLVEARDLERLQADRSVRLLDARGKGLYQDSHVPGAVWVDHLDWARAFAKDPDAREWTRRLGKLGIDADTRVVVYDDGVKDAARIWWILRYLGVADVRLLNGGWRAWQASGGKIEKETHPPAEVRPKLDPQTGRLARKDQILNGLKEKPPQIVDARSSEEYCGRAETARRNGSIPGARHLEWSDTLDKTTGRFKSAAELTRLFREAGIDPARPTVTYCQSGGRASVMAFALELMGGKEVSNYYRSWAEWGDADDTPVVKPEPKK